MDDPWKSIPENNGFESESRMIEMDDGWQLRSSSARLNQQLMLLHW